MPRLRSIPLIIASVSAPALAQSDISPLNKFCWQENAGWMNWRDANGGQDGVQDRGTFLAGYIWSENLGWISLGTIPDDSVRYSNTNGADFGVNIATDGLLSGMAWSENAGWLNFSGGGLASPASPARLDPFADRFSGFVWGENVGWVNLDLDLPGKFVQRSCYANCDGSTTAPILNANDFQCFLIAFASNSLSANCDRSAHEPVLNANDFTCFLNSFARGCP